MTLKDIQAKLKKGEDLTDAEKTFLAEYDDSKAVNDAAAAARRKAEDKQAELEKEKQTMTDQIADIQKKLDDKSSAGKTDLEKAQSQIEVLSKQITDLNTNLEKSTKTQTEMSRSQKIADIRRGAGIQFIPELDHKMLNQSFSTAFDGIEELDNEDVIKTKVDTWQAMNKAAILDTSGNGAGSNPNGAGGSGDVKAVKLDGADLIKQALTGDLDEVEKALDAADAADGAGKLEIS